MTEVTVEYDEETNRRIIQSSLSAQNSPDTETLNTYLCEVCGREDECTEVEAYNAGWDYPPFIGVWGIISPRTCPNCLVDQTAYWFIINRGAEDQTPIPENHVATIKRIMAEQGGPSDATPE